MTVNYVKTISSSSEEIVTDENAVSVIEKSNLAETDKERLVTVLKIAEEYEKAMEKGIFEPTMVGLDYLRDSVAGREFKENLQKGLQKDLKVDLRKTTAGKGINIKKENYLIEK